jgi:hypothetical protein
MRSLRRLSFWSCVLSLAAAGAAHAQGRGGGVWTTSRNDAQRTSSVRTDPKISRQSLSKAGFQLLWTRDDRDAKACPDRARLLDAGLHYL